MRDRGDENFIEANRLRDYASEFWEKKKQTKWCCIILIC